MKTVLITGASRGIGRATAKLFAENGYRVIINYLKSEKQAKELEKALLEKGLNAIAIKADVSKSKDVDNMMQQIKEKFGGVDVLVNNAGLSFIGQVNYTEEEVYDKLFAVNMKGVHLCTLGCLPFMIDKKQGVIINVSSIWGKVGASCEAVYSASKSAVIGYTKALSKELGLSGIRVNCVAPGVINTEMNSSLTKEDKKLLSDDISLGRLGETEEVAKAILFFASDDSSYVTGQVLTVDGGFIE